MYVLLQALSLKDAGSTDVDTASKHCEEWPKESQLHSRRMLRRDKPA